MLSLDDGPQRFNQLLTVITGISDRVLTERLRELEAESVIVRAVDLRPVRVTYYLTERGRRYVGPLRDLEQLA